MKKQYLIPIALILLLSAYLLFYKDKGENYTLPEIRQTDTSEMTELILEKKQGTIRFVRKENNWFLTDKAYPADPSLVENMLDTFKTLKLSALVSQQQDLKRYDLDDENRIQVKAIKGQEPVFEFAVGKTAPTYNHTFVMVLDDKNIYHANGNFRSHFDKTVEDFRDKKVLEFKEASLKRFTVEKDGRSKTFIPREDKENTSPAWDSEDGSPTDNTAASSLLSSISFLECEHYLDSPSKTEFEKKDPLCRIILENDRILGLTLFSQEEEKIQGISSMNSYSFELSTFNGKEIVSQIEKLLEIDRKEE